MYEVIDDFGLLAILDPNAYVGFIDSYASVQQVFDHFVAEMNRKCLLMWGTGRENIWRIDVRVDPAEPCNGFRHKTGPLAVSDGFLCLSNYWTLAGAAEDENASIPQENEFHLYVRLPSGNYVVRVVQMFDVSNERVVS